MTLLTVVLKTSLNNTMSSVRNIAYSGLTVIKKMLLIGCINMISANVNFP